MRKGYMQMYDFKKVGIYIDPKGKLIGVPCGRIPGQGEYDIALLDVFFTLEPDYTDDELEKFFYKVFDACYSRECGDLNGITAMQKYTGAKSYVSAVKGYQHVGIDYYEGEYTFRPSQIDKKHRGAFMPIKCITIKVSLYSKYIPVEKGALALAFKQSLEIIKQTMPMPSTQNEPRRQVFDLLCDKQVSYIEPRDEHFINAGDYGVGEIYQSYSYHKKEGSDSVAELYFSIAAELDCDIDSKNIRRKWEQQYGIADVFEVTEACTSVFTLRTEFKNKKTYKASYFRQLNEHELFACELEIRRAKTGKQLDAQLIASFEEFAKSVVLS